MAIIMSSDMLFLKTMLHYIRERLRYFSLTSTTYFALREIINIGPFRGLWALILQLKREREYLGMSIHNAPHYYIPTTAKEVLYLLKYHKKNLELLLKFIDINFIKGSRILEIGPGNSLGLLYLLLKLGAREVIGLQPDPINPYLDKWIRKLLGIDDEAVGKKVKFIQVQAESIPLPNESIDLAISFAVLEHVWDPIRVVRELSRVTKQGGQGFHVIDLKDHRRTYNPLTHLTIHPRIYRLARYFNKGLVNTLRCIDWIKIFQLHGFKVRVKRIFIDEEIPHEILVKIRRYYPHYTLNELKTSLCILHVVKF